MAGRLELRYSRTLTPGLAGTNRCLATSIRRSEDPLRDVDELELEEATVVLVRVGGPHRKNFLSRVYRPAVRRAGLEPLRWHDLRHTSAALAISVGAHPKVIQQRLGHSSIKTTLDVYGGLFPNLDVALAEALDDLAREAAAAYLLPAGSLAVVSAGTAKG